MLQTHTPELIKFFTELHFLFPYQKLEITAKANVWGETTVEKIKLTKVEVFVTDGNKQKLLKNKQFIEEIKLWVNSQYFTAQVAADLMKFTLGRR